MVDKCGGTILCGDSVDGISGYTVELKAKSGTYVGPQQHKQVGQSVETIGFSDTKIGRDIEVHTKPTNSSVSTSQHTYIHT